MSFPVPEEELAEHRKRRWLGKPLRDISIHCNPRKISLMEFVIDVQEGVQGFHTNMKNLKSYKHEDKYIEEHMAMFLAWFELEQEDGN